MTLRPVDALLIAGFAMAAVPVFPALAQTVPLGPDPAPPATIEQIPVTPGNVPISPSRNAAASPQLTADEESARPAHQLSSKGQSSPTSVQVYKGKRTAQASAPLSSPAEGRTAATERVEGKDRCDPASKNRETGQGCDKVIETRADEFARPDTTPLSPEQRIIIAQQIRDRATTATGAAKLLASGSLDADSAEGQEVASIVLKRPPEAPKKEKPDEPSSIEEQAAAVINAIVNQAPIAPR